MGQGILSLSSLAIDGWFPGQASWSLVRYRETSVRSGPGWKSPRPLPRRLPLYKVRGRVESAAVALELLGTIPPVAAPPGTARSQLHRELRGLPAGTMRGFELPLLLLALVLCQAPRGPAAPVSAGTGGGTVLAKMYPRGSHWAVGKCPDSEIPRCSCPQREGTSTGGNLSPQLFIWLGSLAWFLSFY